MKDRIKELRKALNLNQEEFASKIGLARNSVASYEIGRREPTNSIILSISREFDVNENWLRTGEGKMFVDLPEEDEYFKAATQIAKADDKLAMQILIEYWKLDDAGKRLLKNFILHIAEKSKE